ncbi:MAG: trigger factor [Termitinemataceae bacterium]|nr:MAG: trigger factor [Termitinemataceae bacterium]
MPVQREIENLEKSAVKLTFTIKNDELLKLYNTHVKNLAKDVRIPGFRIGKVPLSVLERKFGDLLKEDVLNSIISETVKEVFKEPDFPEDSKPLGYEDLKVDGTPKLDLATDLIFSVIYDVAPKVNLEKYEGLEVEVDYAEITEEDIEDELQKLRDRNAIVIDKDENATAKDKDIVTVDYCELDDTGCPIKSSERKDFSFTLGTEYSVFKFDKDIIDMKVGETREFSKKLDDNFPDESLAGKTVKLRVVLKSLKEKQLPDLDDDFAQDVGEEFKNLADLKASISENLNERLKAELEKHETVALFAKIAEANPFEVPESMIKAQNISRFKQIGFDDKTILNLVQADSNIISSGLEDAKKTLKTSFILEEFFKKNTFEVSEDDIKSEIEKIVKTRSMDLDKAKEYYEKTGTNMLNERIQEEKAVALLKSKNNIKKGKKVSLKELFPIW